MIVVLSGEGPTDFGASMSGAGMALFEDIQFGPLAEMIEQLAFPILGYSLRECVMYRLIDKSYLSDRSKSLKALKKKSLALPGKKRAEETAYFYANARALADAAKQVAGEVGCDTVAMRGIRSACRCWPSRSPKRGSSARSGQPHTGAANHWKTNRATTVLRTT